MTRAEILDCLTDRPCDSCKFHESGRCERWDCVFEEKPEDAEPCREADDCENEIADLQNRLDIAEYDKERWKEKVTALEEKLKSLSAEPCEDCISRQEVLDGIEELKKSPWATDKRGNGFEYLIKEALEVVADLCVKQLPSVTPKQKMGHWILDHVVCDVIYEYHCSACGHHLELGGRTIKQDQAEGYSLFCNGCGAKMHEVDE